MAINKAKDIVKEMKKLAHLPARDIAKKLGIAVPTVYMRFKKLGIPMSPRGNKPLPDKIVNEILNLSAYGMPVKKIAETVKISPVTVRKFLKESGIAVAEDYIKKPLPEATVTKIETLYKNGYKTSEIAQKLNVSLSAVNKRLKRLEPLIVGRKYKLVELQMAIEKAGFNLSKAGELLGISRANMSDYVSRYALDDFVREGKKAARINTDKKIEKMLAEKKTIGEIADAVGKPLKYVAAAAVRFEKNRK
jgi:DNA-binding Lrp family transcriptional regulator